MLNALPSLFLCIQIGPRNKTHMCSGSRVGSSLNGPLLISTPLIWRLMGFLHWALRWVTWPRKDPLQPSTLPPVRETDRMVNGEKRNGFIFLLYVWFWNSRRVTVSGSSASTTTVCFQSMKLTTERKRGRKTEWDRHVYVFERSSLCCLVYAPSTHTIFYDVLFMLPWAKRSNVIINSLW